MNPTNPPTPTPALSKELTWQEATDQAKALMNQEQCKCGVCFANLVLRLRRESREANETLDEGGSSGPS